MTEHVSYEESLYPSSLIERLGGLETYYQNSQEREASQRKKEIKSAILDSLINLMQSSQQSLHETMLSCLMGMLEYFPLAQHREKKVVQLACLVLQSPLLTLDSQVSPIVDALVTSQEDRLQVMDSQNTFKELVFRMVMALIDRALLVHLPVSMVDSLLELLFCNLDDNITVYQRQARHCLSALVDSLSSLPPSSQETLYKALLNKYLYASLMYIVLQLNSA